MSMIDELKGLQVDVEEAIARMNHNKALYEKMLVKYVNLLRTSVPVLDADEGRCEDILETAHAIKGASGNLSVVPLYEAYSQIVDLLRAGQQQEAKELIRKVRPVQEEIIGCIEKYA